MLAHVAAKKAAMRSRLKAVQVQWQREGDARNPIAGRLEDLTPLSGNLRLTVETSTSRRASDSNPRIFPQPPTIASENLPLRTLP